MRLFGTKTSPFVRKVRVTAAELGIDDRIAFEVIDFGDPPPDFVEANPTRRVPTLITDDGVALFDSPVIAEWLDAELGANRLLPAKGPERWAVLKTEALADGLLDSGTSVRHERQRPATEQSPAWIEKQLGKVASALERLEADDSWRSSGQVDLGQIAVACALGWLNLRLPELLDRERYPGLLAWYDGFSARPSMTATAPD
jgi:glutathione S-transferase